MIPYIILILFVFIWRTITAAFFRSSKGNRLFLIGTFIFLYVFCVIRSFEVGRDVPGYIDDYNYAATISWSQWKVAHFEVGYVFLMKVSNMIGLNARGFFYIVYFIILAPIWFLFKTESPRPLISVIIFICFQFFVFDLTGIRQAMASSICIIAFIYAQKPSKKHLILFAILVFCASLIHRSAISFAVVYPLLYLRLTKITILLFVIVAVIFSILNVVGVRVILNYYNNTSYHYSTEDSQQIGGSLFFLFLFACLGIILYGKKKMRLQLKEIVRTSTIMVLTGICVMLLANGSTLLRASMYFYFPMTLLPAYIANRSFKGVGLFIKSGLIAILLYHFFTAEINSLDVSPYRIGDKQEILR